MRVLVSRPVRWAGASQVIAQHTLHGRVPREREFNRVNNEVQVAGLVALAHNEHNLLADDLEPAQELGEDCGIWLAAHQGHAFAPRCTYRWHNMASLLDSIRVAILSRIQPSGLTKGHV
jgi:hypothetical protein